MHVGKQQKQWTTKTVFLWIKHKNWAGIITFNTSTDDYDSKSNLTDKNRFLGFEFDDRQQEQLKGLLMSSCWWWRSQSQGRARTVALREKVTTIVSQDWQKKKQEYPRLKLFMFQCFAQCFCVPVSMFVLITNC